MDTTSIEHRALTLSACDPRRSESFHRALVHRQHDGHRAASRQLQPGYTDPATPAGHRYQQRMTTRFANNELYCGLLLWWHHYRTPPNSTHAEEESFLHCYIVVRCHQLCQCTHLLIYWCLTCSLCMMARFKPQTTSGFCRKTSTNKHFVEPMATTLHLRKQKASVS